MPKTRVTSIKLPAGTPCPPGFQERTTRSGTRCFKIEVAPPAPTPSMDEMMSMFGNMGIQEAPLVVEVEDAQVGDLMNMFGVMGIGGKLRTRKVRKTRRHRKSRK